jgi:hypothetical protein
MAKANPIQLAKSLKGAKYPASKADLLKAAKANGADAAISALLGRLPEQSFARPTEVAAAVKALA